MTENPGRLRALLDDTLAGEPPLLDLVPDAVTGAEHSRRRGRMIAGGAAAAVLAVSVGVYGLADHGASGNSESQVLSPGGTSGSSGSGGSPAHSIAQSPHKSTLGIPGLFDHPGTPQGECAKVNDTAHYSKAQLSSPAEQNFCVRSLTAVRALLPDAVVVLNPSVDFDQAAWDAALDRTPNGGTVPGFAQAYQQTAKNAAKVVYRAGTFAVHTANGDGLIFYTTSSPGVQAKPEPGGNLPLGDGTFGGLSQDPGGGMAVSGVAADGVWYSLSISGVGWLSGSAGKTAGSTDHQDMVLHQVFPDGYVAVGGVAQSMSIPNPFTATEIRDLVKAHDLGNLVSAVGADPLSADRP